MKALIGYSLIFFLVPICFSFAQENRENSIKAVYNINNEKVELRWAPSNYPFWQKTVESGYIIQRFTIKKNDSLLAKPTLKTLNGEVILPKALDDWEELVIKDDYAAVAAQCLYGEELNILGSESDVFSIYNKANEQISRYSLAMFSADQSIEAARYLGLYFADHDINMNESYLYRIFTPATDVSYDTALIYVDLRVPKAGLSMVDDITIEQNDNNTILLQWDINIIESDYISYEVLRRNKQSDYDFEKINEQSLIYIEKEQKKQPGSKYMIYADSVTNEGNYQYLISGKTLFGEQHIICDTLNFEMKFKESLPIPFIKDYDFINKNLNIKWDIDGREWRNTYQATLLTSESVDGEYKIVEHKKELSSFLIDSYKNIAYYKIRLKDEYGQFKESKRYMIQVIDSIPPLPPIGLKGSIDENGNVSLSWEDNSEDDLLGYKIFKSNYLGEEPSELSAKVLKENNYIEKLSLKTLNDKVHYYIAALDNNYNQSGLSDPLVLERPNNVKPDAPFIKDVVQDGNEIKVYFAKSSSPEIDKYLLYVRKNDGKFELKDISSEEKNHFVFGFDPKENSVHNLYFVIIAVNGKGMESDPSNLFMFKLNHEVKIMKLNLFTEKGDNNLLIKWDVKEEGRVKIYQKIEDEYFLVHESVNNGFYKEKKINNKRLTYLVTLITKTTIYEGIYIYD